MTIKCIGEGNFGIAGNCGNIRKVIYGVVGLFGGPSEVLFGLYPIHRCRVGLSSLAVFFSEVQMSMRIKKDVSYGTHFRDTFTDVSSHVIPRVFVN